MELQKLQARYAHHQPTLYRNRGNYAVLVPLVETENGLCLLYEVRAGGIRQPHEVCFPGGRMEQGESPAACAVRETGEELGIPAEDIELIGPMDFLHLRSESLMYPVLAHLRPDALDKLRRSEAEVADTFLVPLSWLRQHPPQWYRYPLRPMIGEDFPYDTVQVSPDYRWGEGRMEVPVYEGLPYPLWGLTARVTHQLIETLE